MLDVDVECDDDLANVDVGLNDTEWVLNHDVEDDVVNPDHH